MSTRWLIAKENPTPYRGSGGRETNLITKPQDGVLKKRRGSSLAGRGSRHTSDFSLWLILWSLLQNSPVTTMVILSGAKNLVFSIA
jgi:hypothetical protein